MTLKPTVNILVLIGLALAGIFYFKAMEESSRAKRELANISALSDSVRVYKTKTEELGAEKLSLQASSEELKRLNKGLYEELQKEKGNVKVITKTEVVLSIDTLFMNNVLEMREDRFKLAFEDYNENRGGFRKLKGYTEFRWNQETSSPFDYGTTITENTLSLNLITGVRKEDNNLTIFVRTEYPGIEFRNIEGAVINPEDMNFLGRSSNFTFGPQIGVGWTPYGVTPYIGVGAQYKLMPFSFLK